MGNKRVSGRKVTLASKVSMPAKRFGAVNKSKGSTEVAGRTTVKFVRFGKNRLVLTPYDELEGTPVTYRLSDNNVVHHKRIPRFVKFIGKIVND